MIAHPKIDAGIRRLKLTDVYDVTSIFNETIERQECTNDVRPRTAEQMKAWLTADLPDYETFVYETAAGIVGWSAITRYHEREAYRPTVELVTFVTRAARRFGIGGELMRNSLRRAKALGFHSAVIIVFPEPLYVVESAKKLGFVELGRLHGVFPAEGSWRDVVLLQHRL
jgi:L-amino acid N-acyltransferase YncA